MNATDGEPQRDEPLPGSPLGHSPGTEAANDA
jgi:hypothetical protein